MLGPVLVIVLTYLSCIGWGLLISKAVALRIKPDIGLTAAWGTAFSAVLGGALSVLGDVRPSVVRVYVISGALLGVLRILPDIRRWKENNLPKLGPLGFA